MLTYMMICSLDGYVADADGRFDWGVPDEEVLAHVNDAARPVGTYLYGRRIYELMTGWEHDPAAAEQSPGSAEFARIWQAARKVVFSTSLGQTSTRHTTLERTFDPDAVARLARESDVSVAGPTLAAHAHALRAGLVDEVHLVVCPVVVGGGLRVLPEGVRVDLSLAEERRFASGVVALRYRVQRDA